MFQQSLEDLGTPLRDVTFCVIDLETTGGKRNADEITEIGAIKYRGGEVLGTFQTLVDPGRSIPPEITVLTGITSAMVDRAPRVEQVLPTLLEFLGDAVIVGHNVGFDLAFLNSALARSGRKAWAGTKVDTLAIARRLIRDEAPNHKLSTLAKYLRFPNQPSHRALDDAKATGDLLHYLLERASALGVLGLDDLTQLPKIQRHPQAKKLRLTESLPRKPGVYRFLNERGEVLYVGKATNLRARVRSYFSSDRRRKVEQLLRETQKIEHDICSGTLEAEVLEVRQIQKFRPRFNRRSKNWSKYTYVKLTLGERFPRLSVVREQKDDEAFYLGPVSSHSTARDIVDAIEAVVPLRRCTQRVPKTATSGPCVSAQIGTSVCPCSGKVTEESYSEIVDYALSALSKHPERLLHPLREKMTALASQQRFEEASELRERAAALSNALQKANQVRVLRSAGRIVLEVPDEGTTTLLQGQLVENIADPNGLESCHISNNPLKTTDKKEIDELWCVATWLNARAPELRLLHCDAPLFSQYPSLDDFRQTKSRLTRPGR